MPPEAPGPATARDGMLDNAALALDRSKTPGLMPAEAAAAEDLAAALVTAANQIDGASR